MTICSRCVMDSSDSTITFNDEGECCYCTIFDGVWASMPTQQQLEETINRIKEENKGKPYDCLLGVSGGPDSSYLAYLCKQYDFRVLLVHVSNGFDTPQGHHNVEMIRQYTGYDIKHVILDSQEFCDLNRSFLYASVIDVDIPADHAIVSVQWKEAIKHKLRYLLTGYNVSSEFYMPRTWTYENKNDLTNLKNIHRQFGSVPLKTFPLMGAFQIVYYRNRFNFIYVHPLNYVPYSKLEVIKFLMREWGWQPNGHKHYENIFTRFYQAYILPTKFGVDKRKSHLSSLIRSGALTRDEVLRELEKSPYEPTSIFGVPIGSATQFEDDKKLVLSKLGLTEAEFQRIMALPIRSHKEFGSDAWVYAVSGFPRRSVRWLRAHIGLRTRIRRLFH